MAKLNHQKRGRPRPKALRRRDDRLSRAEFDTRRSVERWERQGPVAAGRDEPAMIEGGLGTTEQVIGI